MDDPPLLQEMGTSMKCRLQNPINHMHGLNRHFPGKFKNAHTPNTNFEEIPQMYYNQRAIHAIEEAGLPFRLGFRPDRLEDLTSCSC